MKIFNLIFDYMIFAVFAYQMLYFLVQYAVLKRLELFYYSMFLLIICILFYVYQLSNISSINFKPSKKIVFSSLQLSFQFIATFFYMLFISHYLELHKDKPRIYYLVKFNKYYNLVCSIVFVLLTFFKIESSILVGIVTLLSQPLSLAVVVMLWRLNSTYSKVVLYGTSCNTIGILILYFLLNNDTNTDTWHIGDVSLPLQIGLLLDVFILGYGLSLKAAESDKKLVKILLENQQIVEVERSRLAKDLHDGLGGLLSGIKLTLHSISDDIPQKIAPSFSKVINQLDTVIKEMRRVAHNMMPEALLKFGLGEAIQDYCDGINESNIIKIKYTQIGSLQALIQSTAIVLYRIVQELTNNSIKHAAAKNIFIQITSHQTGYTITVEDDGKGFDIKTMPDNKGTGLKNVRTRVEYLKGNFITDSEQDKGTSIIVEIPNNN